MAYVSDNPIFRSLSDEEEAEFRKYAEEHHPPKGASWNILHPVCREVWEKRGLKPPRTLQELARECIEVQDACNLVAVAQAFGRAMVELSEHGLDTMAVRNHPITFLWLDKIADLCGVAVADTDPTTTTRRMMNAHNEVHNLARQEVAAN